jgi:hypothetical protein
MTTRSTHSPFTPDENNTRMPATPAKASDVKVIFLMAGYRHDPTRKRPHFNVPFVPHLYGLAFPSFAAAWLAVRDMAMQAPFLVLNNAPSLTYFRLSLLLTSAHPLRHEPIVFIHLPFSPSPCRFRVYSTVQHAILRTVLWTPRTPSAPGRTLWSTS